MGDTYDGRRRGPSTLHSALDRRSAGVPGDNRPSDQPTLRHEEEGERAIYFIVTTTNRLFTERIWDDDDGMDRQTVGGRAGGHRDGHHAASWREEKKLCRPCVHTRQERGKCRGNVMLKTWISNCWARRAEDSEEGICLKI